MEVSRKRERRRRTHKVKLPATGHMASYVKTAVSETIETVMNHCKVYDIEHMDNKGKEWSGDAQMGG